MNDTGDWTVGLFEDVLRRLNQSSVIRCWIDLAAVTKVYRCRSVIFGLSQNPANDILELHT